MNSASSERFGFGKNWARFVDAKLTEERKDSARQRLLASLKLKSLEGLVFLDIGCGSGLHSLAAFRSGAKSIVSFDYDPDSVRTTEYLWRTEGCPAHWKVMQGSVLDTDFMRRLPKADIVYSWGVLHHTGDVWKALENAAIPLASQGILFIALYSYLCYENTALHGGPSPEKWLEIKQAYNQATPMGKRWWEWRFVLTSGFSRSLWKPWCVVRSLWGAFREARKYYRSRGMDYWTDIRDWLGGWPMAFVKEADCMKFCRERLGLECIQMNTGEGNTEYLFRPRGAKNYWDEVLTQSRKVLLKGPYQHMNANLWRCEIPRECRVQKNWAMAARKGLKVIEDGEFLSFSNSDLKAIESLGAGRYKYSRQWLFFSSSDNSNPNENQRPYAMVWSENSTAS